MAGSAISAESQWKRSRVASSAPDQTETESSMMLPAAKPATAMAADQLAADVVAAGGIEGGGVEGTRGVAEPLDRRQQLGGVAGRRVEGRRRRGGWSG